MGIFQESNAHQSAVEGDLPLERENKKKNLLNQFTITRLKYGGGGDWYSDPSSIPNLLRFVSKGTAIKTATKEIKASIKQVMEADTDAGDVAATIAERKARVKARRCNWK